MVEHRLPKPVVAGSIPVSRSMKHFFRIARVTVHSVHGQWKNETKRASMA
jgi:hypothetical protein